MKHKLFPFVAGMTLTLALLAPATHAAPGDSPATTESGGVLPIQELSSDVLFLILLGEIAGSRGDLPVSAEAYLHAARQTLDPRIARRATEIALVARDMDSAAAAARIWLDTDPASEDARRMLAGILATRGDQMNEVQIELARILANSEGQRLEQNLLGLNRALSPMQDKALVREIVERLTEPYLMQAPAHFARAQAYAGEADDLAALGAVDQALRLRPDWEPAVVLKSQLLVQLNAVQEALDLLGDYLTRHPDSRNAAIAHARSRVSAQDYAGALAEFRALQARYPDDIDLIYAVAVMATQTGDFVLAVEHFRRALEAGHPERDAILFNLASIAERTRRTGDALALYREIAAGPHHLDAQIRIAHLLAEAGHLDAARAHLHQAEVEPDDRRRLIFTEVLLLRNAERTEEALQVIDKALLEAPEDADLLYEAGMLAERLDQLDRMEQYMRLVMEIEPDHAHAYNALGYTLAERGIRLEEAEELIIRALELAPDDPFILDSMGWVHFRRNQAESALDYLQRAYGIRSDPEIAAHLGEVLWTLGRRDEASGIWDAALRNAPDNAVLSETVQRLRGR
ncbi:MAG: tetratricopeptide repeat protein [Pseudazoarcus pumilus]|nr:tetratricopeptide repeat protein [Pseudazoarcus pumilus]